MKRNKKLAAIALSVMLVMTLAVTVISFSLANLRSGNNAPSVPGTITTTTGAALTNVDYIIKAGSEEGSEPYKIVEIGSKRVSGNTAFGSFSTDGSFKEYVLKGNTTLTDTTLIDKFIANGTIQYRYYYSGDVSGDNTDALSYISSADLIYVSALEKYSISGGNDLSEDLYNLLHVAAVGDYKPFIIDKASSGGSQQDISGDYTMNDMIARYYIKMGSQYKSYYWNDTDIGSGSTTAEATTFYQAAIGSGSNYVGINGRVRQAYWMDVKTSDTASDKFKMADVLVISSSGSSLGTEPMFNKLMAGSAGVTSLYEVKNETTATAITVATNQKLYNIAGSTSASTDDTPIKAYGYNSRYAISPDYIRATEITLAQLEASLHPSTDPANPTPYADLDFADYDMVIFADDCADDVISSDLYKKLVGVMYANTQVVYNYSLGNNGSGGTGGSGGTVDTDSNFYELYSMVATKDDIARYPNVMITDKAKMDIITASKSAETCKCIADIINNGSFRGIGGPGSTATTFTVLEIQPCYPIDETVLANNNGKYYEKPSEVIDGKTKEQIGDAGDDRKTEYYAWELSEAKIADALNMNVNQVKVVHMSSEEFASSKDAILGNYDMIYIGGNRSALKSTLEWKSIETLANGYADISYSITQGFDEDNLVKLPIYTMYTNVGDFVQLDLDFSGQSPGPVNSGSPMNVVPGAKSDGSDTFFTLNGNDITYADYTDLCSYVDAGMPVIVSKDVYDAYHMIDILKANNKSPYLQNSIDPDSNMYKFLLYCANSTHNNVLMNFDQTQIEYVDNDGGRLGDTLTGTVEIFKHSDSASNPNNRDNLIALYNSSNKRPKLAVTSMPAVYNLYDETTKLDSLSLSYEFDVTGTTDYTVNLYADYDMNSVFIDDEIIATDKNVTSISANLANIDKYGDEHSGPVYWKLEIVDNGSGATVSTSKIAFIKDEESKKQINVLQILPEEGSAGGSLATYEGNGAVTLIFCTECQRALEILDYNPGTVSKLYTSVNDLYFGHLGSDKLNSDHEFMGAYMGRHQHKFGIVKYESGLAMGTQVGVEDWDANFADELSDTFDFDIDIMTTRQFETANTQVQLDLRAYLTANFDGKTLTELSEKDKEKLNNMLQDDATTAGDNYADYMTMQDVIDNDKDMKGRTFNQLLAAEKVRLGQLVASQPLAKAEYDLKMFLYNLLYPTTEAGITELNNIKSGAVSSVNTAYEMFTRIYENDVYYDYFLYVFGEDIPTLNKDASKGYWHYAEYKKLYEEYAKCVDKKLELKDAFDQKDRLAHYDNWLLGCYQSVIIGPAEDFAGDDIKNAAALDTLINYIKKDGQMLLFHDTLTKFSDNGSVNLTKALVDYYGMDKNQVKVDDSVLSGNKVVDVEVAKQTNYQSFSVKTASGVSVVDSGFNRWTNQFVDVDASAGQTWSCTQSGTVKVPGVMTFRIRSAHPDTELRLTIGSEVYTGTTNATGYVEIPVNNYTVQQKTYTPDDVYYIPYVAKDSSKTDEYYMSNLSYKPLSDTSRYYSWADDIGNIYSKFPDTPGYYGATYAFTDSMNLAGTVNKNATPYKYATLSWAEAAKWNNSAMAIANGGSDKASQTNKGILTMYPFTLSDELNISPTHAQAYALDLENQDLSVWYTLGGGTLTKDSSSLYAASPRDGMDSYFIYTVGNLNYCSAGHCEITGPGRDNNDERRLYINIICNSVTNIAQTSIKAYDYISTNSSKSNNVVKKNGSEYIYKLDEGDNYPEFSFMFDLGHGASVKEVNVYYDIDDNRSFTTGVDKYIKRYSAKEVEEGKLIYVPISIDDEDELETLYLDPAYLTNGKYVYVVIEVVDSDNNRTRKRIKVEYKDKLYNLT